MLPELYEETFDDSLRQELNSLSSESISAERSRDDEREANHLD